MVAGGGGVKWENLWNKKKPKSTLLAGNTQGLQKQTKQASRFYSTTSTNYEAEKNKKNNIDSLDPYC